MVMPARRPLGMCFPGESYPPPPESRSARSLHLLCTALLHGSSIFQWLPRKGYVSQMKGSAAVVKAPRSAFQQTDDGCVLWDEAAVTSPGLVWNLTGVGNPGSLCPSAVAGAAPFLWWGSAGRYSVPRKHHPSIALVCWWVSLARRVGQTLELL